MAATVSVVNVRPRKMAVVRRQVAISGIAAAWRPALDQVWAFLRSQPGLHTNGHNVFLYHHPAQRGALMEVEFGVEVCADFASTGDVHPAETPAGMAAMAIHVGDYAQLPETHDAIHAWAREQKRSFAGCSWEIYGDWTEDSSKLETAVLYLLA